MANIVMVLGESGTGKSTSIKGLNPDDTVIINTLNKRLPFKDSGKLYSKEKKNIFSEESYDKMIKLIQNISNNAPHVHNIVLDDIIYIMRKEYFKRAKEAGYAKYTELAQHMQQIISTCEAARLDLNVFMLFHSEDVVSDGVTTGHKVATVGKLLDNQYNPIEVVPMVLYSDVHYDDKGTPKYGFYTHRIIYNKTVIPAKTPDGMFQDDFIDNDLGKVVAAMKDYYGE